MKKLLYTILFLTSIQISVFSQEVLTFPSELVKTINKKEILKRNTSEINLIDLPFYDDFSVISGSPNNNLWEDNDAYVNTDYAKFPPTVGVATLDAVDGEGKLYPDAGQYPFKADNLTSLPIRLDSVFVGTNRPLRVSDSLYLSFYYQPQGRGLMPSNKDSLILEFHSPLEIDTLIINEDTTYSKRWTNVWSTVGGVSADSFALSPNRYFRQVIVPVLDSAKYYHKGFQFRFRNIASLSDNFLPDWRSNCDQWNVDVVWLNVGRSINDSIVKDVAFADKAPSMLKRYYSMPYNQYNANFLNEMKDSIDIKIANLDNLPRNLSYHYLMKKDSNPYDSIYGGGNYFIQPYLSHGYSNYKPFSRPPVSRFFPLGTNQKTVFHVCHVISNDPDVIFNNNDTIIFSQEFNNFYAYDDGTAEAGIGLNNAPGAYVVRFQLNVKDTLQGIKIYFNQVAGQSNQKNIDLIIMNDKNGMPGNIVYSIDNVIPIYTDNLNQYHTYWLQNPQLINSDYFPSLIFYVGWKQNTNDNINIGFDRYNDSHQYRYYNISGIWEKANPTLAGSLMIRPVIGYKNPLAKPVELSTAKINIFPNPLTDNKINIELPDSWKQVENCKLMVEIFSTNGIKVTELEYSPELHIPYISKGVYFIILKNIDTNQKAVGKLIKI